MNPHRPLVAAALLVSTLSAASPRPGDPLPYAAGKDLRGASHQVTELRGSPSLVVVVTDRDAAPEAKEWMEAAVAKFGEDVGRMAIVSLDLPGLVPRRMVVSRIKKHVPSQHWSDVLADDTGKLAAALGVSESERPTVLALDSDLKVVAVAEGPVSASGAKDIWSALRSAR